MSERKDFVIYLKNEGWALQGFGKPAARLKNAPS
jgi:hypothetical protein